jgi:hypothetical protein
MNFKALLIIVLVLTLPLLWNGLPSSSTAVESLGDSLGREANSPLTPPHMDLVQLSIERNQMTTDATNREPNVPHPQWKLPDILDIKITRIPYQAPKPRYFETYLAKYTEAIEFLVKTTGPLPIRALSPVLYVGDVPINEYEVVGENIFRFLAFEPDQLVEGAPISLGWPGQPPEKRIKTRIRYELNGDNQE